MEVNLGRNEPVDFLLANGTYDSPHSSPQKRSSLFCCRRRMLVELRAAPVKSLLGPHPEVTTECLLVLPQFETISVIVFLL